MSINIHSYLRTRCLAVDNQLSSEKLLGIGSFVDTAMGLHANWKPLLKELYGESFIKSLPTEESGEESYQKKCQVLLIDFLPMIFGKSKAIKTGEHFLNFVFKFIRTFFDQGGDTCVILIDQLQLVPLAKGSYQSCTQFEYTSTNSAHLGLAPTQSERDKYAKPLSESELGLSADKGSRTVMSHGPLIHQEWHRVMANR